MLLPSPRRLPATVSSAFLLRYCHHSQTRTFIDAKVRWARDRALDHAVEKEKHLHPFHSLKNLLLLHSPSDSHTLPLSLIAEHRHDLRLPFRAIRFIRLFPSAFLEVPSPSSSPPRPLIRPTPDLLRIHEDEQPAHASSRPESANRLLRLLMIAPRRRIPLPLIDRLRWDLGLPHDYARSLIPDYPDYFQIVAGRGNDLDLELVCYSKDLAVSAMERYGMRTGGYKKGMSLAFPLQFSRGFDLEKKVKKWVEEWQKLPYISPYEDATHLTPKSDLAEKWTVGVLHELLHLLVPKKTEMDNLLLLAEHIGLRPGFKKVIAHHPGIFYVSNKLRTRTVVLREAYKRDLLVEKHPLMGLRYHYIHLMHKGRENIGAQKDRKSKRTTRWSVDDAKIGEEEEEYDEDDEDDEDDAEDEEEDDDEEDELSGTSDTEIEDEESDDEDEESDDEDVETDIRSATRESILTHGGEMVRIGQQPIEMKRSSSPVRSSPIESRLETRNAHQTFSRRTEMPKGANVGGRSRGRTNYSRADQRSSSRRTST